MYKKLLHHQQTHQMSYSYDVVRVIIRCLYRIKENWRHYLGFSMSIFADTVTCYIRFIRVVFYHIFHNRYKPIPLYLPQSIKLPISSALMIWIEICKFENWIWKLSIIHVFPPECSDTDGWDRGIPKEISTTLIRIAAYPT